MVIEQLSILNYKNIEQAELTFSPKINCFVGANGMGKTNVLDALYYLSFCRSHTNPVDAQVVRHGAEFLMLQGKYLTDEGEPEVISCGLKPGRRKRFKRGDKEYRRLAERFPAEDVPLYALRPDNMDPAALQARLEEADYLLLSSASGVDFLLDTGAALPPSLTCVCIGPVTAKALAARSDTPFLTAPDISAESVVQTLADHAAQSGRI